MIINILHLIRIKNIIISQIVIIVSFYLLNTAFNSLEFIITIVTVSSLMSFGNCINDIFDYKNDIISHPKRVLPQKKLSIITANNICMILFFAGIFVSSFLNFKAQVFLYCFIMPLLILYSIKLKAIPLVGNIVIASLLASVLIFSELVIFQTYHKLIIPTLLIFGFSLLREIIKDLQDYDGDKKYNLKTLPVYFGICKTINFLIFLIIAFIFISTIPFFIMLNYNMQYLVSIIIIIEIPLIFILFLLIKYPNKIMFKSIAYITKIMSILGLLVFILL